MTTVQRIQELREHYPRWGREKLRVLLERDGIHISAKSVDRVIARLKARGALPEPVRPKRGATLRRDRPRRPPGLVVDRPGALVQMDRKHVSLGGGKLVYHFGALDCFTRKRVVGLAKSLSSQQGAEFLRRDGQHVLALYPQQAILLLTRAQTPATIRGSTGPLRTGGRYSDRRGGSPGRSGGGVTGRESMAAVGRSLGYT